MGALPFFAFGVVCILSKLVASPNSPLTFASLNLAFDLLVVTGLFIGWTVGFPRWSYVYLFWALIFAWWWQSMGWPGAAYVAWGWRAWVPPVLAIAAGLLVTRSLAPLRQLGAGFWHDWTRLSLGLFVFGSFGVALFDENHSPYLFPLMLASTLATGATGWAYLRGRTAAQRILALAAGVAALAVIGGISEYSWDWRAYYGVPPAAYPELEPLRQALLLVIWLGLLLAPALLGWLHQATHGRPAH